MTEHSVFNKKHSETMDYDKKAILEELNLPPVVIDFIRKNQQVLKIAIVVVVLAVIGWEGYGKYVVSQQEKSSAMLYAAINSKSVDDQVSQLQELTAQFSGKKGSGVWGSIELGHIAYEKQEYLQAVEHYQAALSNISSTDPLNPLLQYSLAQTYENLDDKSNSENAYQQLTTVTGFSKEAYLGLARLSEKKGNASQAITHYQNFLNLPETQPGPAKDWAEAKIESLQE